MANAPSGFAISPTNYAELLSKKEDEPYFAALGRFIVAYALAESSVHQLARKLSGLNDHKARVIFGGMRVVDIIDRIRRLLKLAKRSKKTCDAIEDCFGQLDAIGKQRDKLVHRYVDYEANALSVTNYLTAKSILNVEKELFTMTDLETMESDCWLIYSKLTHYRKGRKSSDPWRQKRIKRSWLYTSPKPNTPKKPPHKDQKEYARLLASFLASPEKKD
jgi:hypothetical protein